MSTLDRARWDALSERDQAYLAAVAALGPGPVPVGGVARTLGATNKSLSPRRQSLVEQRLIQAVRFGEVELTTPGMRAWILRTTGRQ